MLYLKKILRHHFRPNKEKTGHVSDSGSSVIKHGLNPEKVFMQVHYLKVSISEWQKPVIMVQHFLDFTYKQWRLVTWLGQNKKITNIVMTFDWADSDCPIVKAFRTQIMRHESKEAELFPSLYLPSPCFMSASKSRILKLLSGSA